ncbi:hypothetical protein KI688_008564 [Linnemannia hyalina]|uniref:RRM domain-containing protein n=1 Tax=Linnemannia hyalina TaxID=64524 RepID=A0A9P8BX95_9FUNG|nr:hypothetical protein KI688_008564 [Linnemannia hyalina]
MSDRYEIDLNVKPGDDLQDEEMAETPQVAIKRKGRGFQSGDQRGDGVHSSAFDKLNSSDDSASGRALKSIEGWIVLITGVHEEATEEDILDKFGEYGEVKNVHLNLDRRTGYVKGYVLVEYEKFSEAEDAIAAMNGAKLLDQTLTCDFAFVKPTNNDDRGRRGLTSRSRGGHGGRRSGTEASTHALVAPSNADHVPRFPSISGAQVAHRGSLAPDRDENPIWDVSDLLRGITPISMLTEWSAVFRTPMFISKAILHKFIGYLEAQASGLIWKPRCSETIAWEQSQGISAKDKTSTSQAPEVTGVKDTVTSRTMVSVRVALR